MEPLVPLHGTAGLSPDFRAGITSGASALCSKIRFAESVLYRLCGAEKQNRTHLLTKSGPLLDHLLTTGMSLAYHWLTTSFPLEYH